jgi:preprotein translocase subunit SecE
MASTKVRGKAARAVAVKPQPEKRSRFSRALGRFNVRRGPAVNRRTSNIATLLRETRQELKKVEWPTREEATKLTAAVVGLSAVVGIFLGGVDFVFQEIFKVLIAISNGGG